MQVPLKEFAGKAQLVKSALIWVSAPLLGFEQSALLAMMRASLSAWSAWSKLVGSNIVILEGTYTCSGADG